MQTLFIALLVVAVAAGDRALVKIGVSRTTISPVITTESSTTTTTTSSTTSTTPLNTLPANVTEQTTSSSSTTTSAPPGNSTGTTEIPEAKNQTTNATEIVKIPRRLRLQQSESYYCKCDLKINICDIDCCCDIDCTGEMLAQFDCHEPYISAEDYHALHGLPSCRISSSLFCVLKSNLHRYDFEEFDESLAIQKIHRWPDVLEEVSADAEGELYRLHDALDEIKIPLSLSGSMCHVQESVKFLRNAHSTCLRQREDNFSTEYLTKLATMEIPPRPKIPCTEASNSCLSVDIFRCPRGHIQNCESFNVTESPEHFPFDLTLKFTHNFTLLMKIEAFVIEKTLQAADKFYHQRIEVIFSTVNESQSHTVSGNIGYLLGKPVIFTHIRSVNISEDKQQPLIDYFHPNRTSEDDDYHLYLPKSAQGVCFLGNSSRESVNFGENKMMTCEIHLSDSINITQESNFTEICRNFHEKILHHLFMFPNTTEQLSSEELFVSEFGNPRNDTSNWIQVDFRGVSDTSIEGIFDSTDETITCRNMIIRAKHLYQFGRLEVAGNRHQALIERASLDFSPRVDLQFKITEDFRVPIFHVVTFIDLTHRVRSSAASWLISWPILLMWLSGWLFKTY